MADVAPNSQGQPKPASLAIPDSATPAQRARQHGLSLDTFSPVTQYGSYEFDRIIKSGEVHKRTRKTKVRMGWIIDMRAFD